MKRFLFIIATGPFLFALLPCVGGRTGGRCLLAQYTHVKDIDTDYVDKTVSVHVHWDSGSRDSTHLNRVWVFVDYQPVTDNTTAGNWRRATVTALPTANNNGVPSFDASTRQGFWLTAPAGNNAFSSTVTIPVGETPAKFNWCAYVSDYPPNAVMHNGTYTLKGTQPFTIFRPDGKVVSLGGTSYEEDCIVALTDPTHCPGIVVNHALEPGSVTGSSTVSVGGTPATGATTVAPSGGSGTYSYQWYKGSALIAGATTPGYTPPAEDALVAGSHTYTRQVADNRCEKKYRPSFGSFELVVNPSCAAAGKSRGIGHCCPGLAYNRLTGLCGTYTTPCGSGTLTGRSWGEVSIRCGDKDLLVQQFDATQTNSSTTTKTCWRPDRLCPQGWRWPSVSELECMYAKKSIVGGFDTKELYWSNEYSGSSSYAYSLNFQNGEKVVRSSTIAHKVRCVKSQ
jgi:hypothetical protein